MGGSISEFEQEFRERYNFIQQINDPFFGLVKVYRKNIIKYDYIMLYTINISSFTDQEVDNFEQRLKIIRMYQNETTLRVYFYKISNPTKNECREKTFIIYAEYLNRNIKQYLAALRTSPHFKLTIEQLIYVLKNIAKSCLTLQKMGIWNIDIKATKVFVSAEGEVLLSPLLYVLESFWASNNQTMIPDIQGNYNKYSVSLVHKMLPNHFPLRHHFISLFLQLSGHISSQNLHSLNNLHHWISTSRNLEDFHNGLPVTVESLSIEQMSRQDNINGQFYKIN